MSGDGYNFKRLRAEILARSHSKSWETARLEWNLNYIFDVDEPEECLCGHFPIIEICVLTTKEYPSTVVVPMTDFVTQGKPLAFCKAFLGADSERLLAARR